MASKSKLEYCPEQITPPGDILLELLVERGMTQANLARRTGISDKTVNEVVRGKSELTRDTAIQLERVLGVPARYWNSHEALYRSQLKLAKEGTVLLRNREWLKSFPIPELQRRKILPDTGDKTVLIRALYSFLGIASEKAWNDVYQMPQVSFRKSNAVKVTPYLLAVWMREGELKAQKIACRPYDEEKFRAGVAGPMRQLTNERNPNVFLPALAEIAARAGVAVVVVKEYPGLGVSGISCWLQPQKAMIQLSLRYKSDHQFWFSFFHEAWHVLYDKKRNVNVDNVFDAKEHESDAERTADRYAAEVLIPPSQYALFVAKGDYTERSVVEFAKRIKTTPGILVGRLQHDGHLPWNRFHHLMVKYEWV